MQHPDDAGGDQEREISPDPVAAGKIIDKKSRNVCPGDGRCSGKYLKSLILKGKILH